MRYSYLLILAFLFSCEAEEDKKVPQVVVDAFQMKYPDEHKEEWNVDRNGNFEAEFKEDGVKYKADFSPSGMWIETECSLKKKELPKPVRDAIKKNYDDHKIVEIEKTDHHKKGLFYDVEFKKDGKKFDIEFSAEGIEVGRED